jgi:hypothetical protein
MPWGARRIEMQKTLDVEMIWNGEFLRRHKMALETLVAGKEISLSLSHG